MQDIALFYFIAQVIERVLELFDWVASYFIPIPEKGGEQTKRGKMIAMWFLACILGFLFAWWLNLHMMDRLGAPQNVWVDRFFTALVLGSGTKPIHDIISLMGRNKK